MEPFLGEIILVGFNFAPRGFALCDGQLLSIAQNTALFALLGTTYGGDGRTTFALPDLRGRAPIHQGQGPGLANHLLGEVAGTESVALTPAQIPPHNHTVAVTNAVGTAGTPAGNFLAHNKPKTAMTFAPAADGSTLNPAAVGQTGGGQGHSNMQPYTVMNFCIATEGIFPSRQ